VHATVNRECKTGGQNNHQPDDHAKRRGESFSNVTLSHSLTLEEQLLSACRQQKIQNHGQN
jgi:hypothetical protein